MTYKRVIPRDFYNEAKLLKCMGRLSLMILDRMAPEHLSIEEEGEPFKIEQDPTSGNIYLMNYRVSVEETCINLYTVMNSKDSYPMYCDTDFDTLKVFNEDGQFTEEFWNTFSNKPYKYKSK